MKNLLKTTYLAQWLACLGFLLLIAGCSDPSRDLEQWVELCEEHYTAKSYKVAYKHCDQAAKQGDAQSQYYLALMLYGNQIEQADKELASKWMEKSATRGFEKAIFHQTISQLVSKSANVDKNKALEILQSYADKGDAVAQYWMGNTFLFGYVEGKKSIIEAMQWFELSAAQSNYAAMNNLAWIKVSSSKSELFEPAKGLELALAVTEKYPESHGYLDTLAAAYAANDEFELAVSTQIKVIELAKKSSCRDCQKDILAYYHQHLENYRNKKPLEEDLLK
ncbi:MAG: sel1 repeat family protein [Kangiellaceae bacterium]|nr:sel1 repeat family protein [Kangiellaceae bacterium]